MTCPLCQCHLPSYRWDAIYHYWAEHGYPMQHAYELHQFLQCCEWGMEVHPHGNGNKAA